MCELDNAILPHVQEGMCTSTEGKVRTVRLPSGHVPMLSMPEKLVEVLKEEAGKNLLKDH